MTRFAAFLRGVSPMNAKMPELRKAFESAGFEDVVTVLSSGNVVFNSKAAKNTTIARKAEAAMEKALGRAFPTIVRPIGALEKLLESAPYGALDLMTDAKRVVTFLRDKPRSSIDLPIEEDGARILTMKGTEVFTAYVTSPKGPVFMKLIEKTFGKNVTTRTWETVEKVSRK